MPIKTIIAAGGGDFTTIAAFAAWVWSTYGSAAFTEPVIGEIQNSATYTENVTFNDGLAPTTIFPLTLRSNKEDMADFPIMTGASGNRITGTLTAGARCLRIEGIKFQGGGNGFVSVIYTANSIWITRCIFEGLMIGVHLHCYNDYSTIRGIISACEFNQNVEGIYHLGAGSYICPIVNNTFYLNDKAISAPQYSNNHTDMKNNVFYVGNGQYGFYGPGATATGSIAYRNNYYISGGGHLGRMGATTYDSLAAWDAATGLDIDSIEQDPLFVDAGAGDFRLQDVSPAKNLGSPDYLLFAQKDIYNADYDDASPSAGAYQNLSVLTPEKAINVYPLGKCADATPTFAWKVGTRDTGGYGANSGTAQYRLALMNRDIGGRLNEPLDTIETTIDYDGEIGTIPASGAILVDSELITYTGKAGGQLTGCTRGAYGTVAATHSDNQIFYLLEQCKDSWATGTYYDAGLAWTYSSNYISGKDPESSGDWSAMGTANPSSSGVEGTNGVSVDPAATRYCKMQLAGIVEGRDYVARLFAYNGATI